MRLSTREKTCVPGYRPEGSRLTVIGVPFMVVNSSGRIASFAVCECDCGEVRAIQCSSMKTGTSKSCGCVRNEKVASINMTHGLGSHELYSTWCHMVSRCHDPKCDNYAYYGGRGIKVCDRWRESPQAFIGDMGERPDGHTLDRIDVNGNYEASNCRWATKLEQANNTRDNIMLTAFGETKTAPEWARDSRCVVPYKLLESRVRSGVSHETAITKPRGKYVKSGKYAKATT